MSRGEANTSLLGASVKAKKTAAPSLRAEDYTKRIGTVSLDFLKAFKLRGGGSPSSVNLGTTPIGNYVGSFLTNISALTPVLTNRYGVNAQVGKPEAPWYVSLLPGQSYNYATKQYSDPKLHPNTAARLNAQVQLRQVNSQGINTASEATTSRGSTGILATIDQLYWGSQLAKVPTGYAIPEMAQAAQGGLDSMSRKTLLSQAPKPTPILPKRRKT